MKFSLFLMWVSENWIIEMLLLVCVIWYLQNLGLVMLNIPRIPIFIKIKFRFFLLNTMFTKGHFIRRHFLQCFGSKHRLLWFTTKNFEPDAV